MPDATHSDAERSLADYTPNELIGIGRAMYEKDVLPQIPHVKKGTRVVMDIVSGDYEIGRRFIDARTRLKRRRPDAVTHFERVGHETPVSMVSIRRPKATDFPNNVIH